MEENSRKKLIIGICCAIVVIAIIVVVAILCHRDKSPYTIAIEKDTVIEEEEPEEEPSLQAVKLRLDDYQHATYDGWTYNFSHSDVRRTNNVSGIEQKMTDYIETEEAWVIGNYLLINGKVGDNGSCIRIDLNNFRAESLGCKAEVDGDRIIVFYEENITENARQTWQVTISIDDFVNYTAKQINHLPHENQAQYTEVDESPLEP